MAFEQQVFDICQQVYTLPPDQRTRALEAHCGDDETLKARVAALIRAAEDAETRGFLEEPLDITPIFKWPDVFDEDESELMKPPLVGKTVRQFNIQTLIAEGGMGDVYLARDTKLDRQVAVKAIKTTHRLDERSRARFLVEAQALSRLDHPHACRILEFLEWQDHDLLVLEYISGQSLRHEMPNLDRKSKLNVAIQMADVLASAHAMSIVHRDLKPENVMLTQDMQVKVLDFGLARFVIEEPHSQQPAEDGSSDWKNAGGLTLAGHVLGTPKYMSPEQAQGGETTAASDMYSFGLILQEMFTGTHPLVLDGESAESAKPRSQLELLARAASGRTRSVQGLPAELDGLIKRLKAVDAKERPSAEQALHELIRFRHKPKRRLQFCATIAAVLILATATAISTWGFVQARRAELRAVAAKDQAEAINAFLQNMLRSHSPWDRGKKDIKVAEVVTRAKESADRDFAEQPLTKAAVLLSLGMTYLDLGIYDQGLECLQESLAIRQRLLGLEHKDTLESARFVCVAKDYLGQYVEARTDVDMYLTISQEQLGPSHPISISLMSHLGNLLKRLDETEAAESMIRRALSLAQESDDTNAPNPLDLMNDLAMVIELRGKRDQAERQFRQALAKHQDELGQRHPSTLRVMNNLAGLLIRQGEYDQAKTMFEDVLKECEAQLGEHHPFTLRTQNNVAAVLVKLGRYDRAEDIFRTVWERRVQHLGSEHPGTLNAQANVAYTLMAQTRLDEAEQLFRQTLDTRSRILGHDHSQTLVTMNHLAQCLTESGRIDEALTIQTDCVTKCRHALPEGHPHRALFLFSLARILDIAGQEDRAVVWYQRAQSEGSKEAAEALENLQSPEIDSNRE